MKNPVTRWTTFGAMSRYLNSFLTDFYLPFYFLRNYTSYTGQFAAVYSLMLVFCSVFSGLVGGYVCDKFGQGKPMMKSWICIIGNLIAMPAFNLAVLCTGNFWFSLAMIATKYIFGSSWKSPAITMMQNTVPPQQFGNIVSAYQFFYIMSGCTSIVCF